MTTIKVPDMMCENCVKRITNALTAAELTFRVDLAAKNVTIDGCENCVKTAVSELEDLGFTRRSRAERQRTPEKAPVSGFGYRYFFNRKSVTNCNFCGSRLEKSKK